MLQQQLEQLNPQQKEAVLLGDKNSLILAGAGSGKTKVLTMRIAHLLIVNQIRASEIFAVTFTNKAAKEMAHRLSDLLGFNTQSMWLGTFHSLAVRFLRLQHELAGLPANFTIIDTSEQLSIIKDIYKQSGFDDKTIPCKQVLFAINKWKENAKRSNAIKPHNDLEQHYITVYRLYENRCQKEHLLDFAELLLKMYEMLAGNEELRAYYQNRFKHILIDEFQDTNTLQYQLIMLLKNEQNYMFAVGDDDQSIYSFRGAKVSNMQLYQKDLSPNIELIRLEQNYRSTSNILNTANAIISKNNGRLGKKLWTDNKHNSKIKIFAADSDIEEAAFIASEIKNAYNGGVNLNDMAVLYRSNVQSRLIEHSLTQVALPYKVYGGLRFYDRAEVKNALAYLRLIANSDSNLAFLRVVNFPPRGIGVKTVESIQQLSDSMSVSLFNAAKNGESKGKIKSFVEVITDLQNANFSSLADCVQIMLEHSGLIEHYSQDKKDIDRVENLQELVSAAQSFNDGYLSNNPDATFDAILNEFLANATLESSEAQATEGQDAVQLMTVHSSKGLEFDTVFIAGLEEGLFPHDNSLREDSLEEERRLMYVAITRAKKELFVTHTARRMIYGQTKHNIRSRFVDEMPNEFLNDLRPRARQQASYGDFQTRMATQSDFFSGKKNGGGFKGDLPFKSGALTQKSTKVLNANKTVEVNGKSFSVGDSVNHLKFGSGVIQAISGSGEETIATISFKKSGTKQLLLSLAKFN